MPNFLVEDRTDLNLMCNETDENLAVVHINIKIFNRHDVYIHMYVRIHKLENSKFKFNKQSLKMLFYKPLMNQLVN